MRKQTDNNGLPVLPEDDKQVKQAWIATIGLWVLSIIMSVVIILSVASAVFRELEDPNPRPTNREASEETSNNTDDSPDPTEASSSDIDSGETTESPGLDASNGYLSDSSVEDLRASVERLNNDSDYPSSPKGMKEVLAAGGVNETNTDEAIRTADVDWNQVAKKWLANRTYAYETKEEAKQLLKDEGFKQEAIDFAASDL